MKFTKDLFISTLIALKDQYDYDKAKSKKLSEIYGSDVMPSDNSRLTNQFFKMLHLQFPPKDGFCRIQCFCYELDFGRNIGSEGFDVTVVELWEDLNE